MPGFGIVPVLYLFVKYSLMKVHVFLADTGGIGLKTRLPIESFVWANLAIRCVRDVHVYHEYLRGISAAVHESDNAHDHQNVRQKLDETFKAMSFDMFASAFLITSTLLWRILHFNMIQIRAHVSFHRKRAIAEMGDVQKAKFIWQYLKDCRMDGFFDLEEEEEEEVNIDPFENLDVVAWLTKYWLDVALVAGSSLFMLLGTLMLNLERVEQRYQKVSGFSFSRFSLWLVICTSTFQTTFFWSRLVWGVLQHTRKFRAQSNRLLLLAAISTPYLEQTWNNTNLIQLDSMLREAAKRNNESKKIGITINKEKKVWEVEVTNEDLKLNLTDNFRDITAW